MNVTIVPNRERADCTVRVTAALTGLPYEEAHAKLAALGRRPRYRFSFKTVADALGLELRPDLACRTLESILPELQSGRFVVKVPAHVFAVVDGVVLDWKAPSPKVRAKAVYQHV